MHSSLSFRLTAAIGERYNAKPFSLPEQMHRFFGH